MKYLLLFLISMPALAQYKIDITNNITGRKYAAKFDTRVELDAWVAKQKNERSWAQKESDLTIVITDISAEVASEEQEKQDRINEIRQIKQALNVIDNSNLPLWHKKILKRLVRELRE